MSACTPASDAQARFICREVDRLGQVGWTFNKDPTAFSLAFLALLRLSLSLSLSSGLRASCLVHGFFASLPACLPACTVSLSDGVSVLSLPPCPPLIDSFIHQCMGECVCIMVRCVRMASKRGMLCYVCTRQKFCCQSYPHVGTAPTRAFFWLHY